MKKLWFFIEGSSEHSFVINLIRKNFFENVLIEKDLAKFITIDVNSLTHNMLYIDDCNGVNNIPFEINKSYYLVQRAELRDIFIVCDVEDLICPANRKNRIESKLESHVDKTVIKYICFNPKIESSYWECPAIIQSVMSCLYKRKYNSPMPPAQSMPNNITHPLAALKYWFKENRLKYRKPEFAKEFFPRVNFSNCLNSVVQRTIRLINSTLDNGET